MTDNKTRLRIYYENNKEKIKENMKLYRELNKEKIKESNEIYRNKIKEKRNEKFKCICGGKFTFNHKAKHLQTKKHQNYLNS